MDIVRDVIATETLDHNKRNDRFSSPGDVL